VRAVGEYKKEKKESRKKTRPVFPVLSEVIFYLWG